MIEKPDLRDEAILSCLREKYRLSPVEVLFLPLGNDSSAWSYRVRVEDGTFLFLKVKKGTIAEASLAVPRFLQDEGIRQVVAPLPAQDREMFKTIGEFKLILYPFIPGGTGMQIGLTASQWTEFGSVLKRIHSIRLPEPLAKMIGRETFFPRWSPMVKKLDKNLRAGRYSNPFEREITAFWQARREEIQRIVERAEELGQMMRRRRPAFVLCHTDIHTANVLIDPQGSLHIVDWDQPLLAPIERDLMFLIGSAGWRVILDREEQRFFSGYGQVEIDPLAIAYYRYEWVVQEIGDFGERVFLMPELGEETRRESVQGFINLFQPGDVVESAYQSDPGESLDGDRYREGTQW